MSISYWTVHERMWDALGNASAHLCRCGRPAMEWAYQHSSGSPLLSPEGRVYSENPKDYAAMCRSCHQKLDREQTPARFLPHTEAATEARRSALQKRWREPEFSTRRKSELASQVNRKRRCLGCGKVSTTYGLGRHLSASGHIGYEDLS